MKKHQASFFFQSEANIQNQFKDQQEQQFQCRICLQGQTIANQLLCPCNCTGSIGYLHFNCLKQWIITNLSQGKKIIKCQMCKQIIVYSLKKVNKIGNCQQIKLKVEKEQKFFVFLVVMIVLCLGLFIYLCTLMGTKIQWLEFALLAFALVIILMFIVIFCINIFKNYLIFNKIEVTHIQSKRPSKRGQMPVNHSNTTLATLKQSREFDRSKIYPIQISEIQ